MRQKEEVIVVFDSGVGGLTVLKEIEKLNIKEKFVYLADSKHAPYGDKTKEEVILHVLESFKKLSYLYTFKSIIIACNTASVYTKELLEHFYKVPVYTVIDAAVEYVNINQLEETADVLSTNLTAKSHAYKNRITTQHIRELGCPRFVPFIESQEYDSDSLRKNVVHSELLGRTTTNAKYVILGCTHYPLLREEIQKFYGVETVLINPSEILACKLRYVLKDTKNIFSSKYFLTGENIFFNSFLCKYMDTDLKPTLLDVQNKKNS